MTNLAGMDALLLDLDVPVAGESGAKAAAVQTLREVWWRKGNTKRLECLVI
jgi:hypothetical protein